MSAEEISAAVIARIRRARRASGMSAHALADAVTACGYKVSRETLAGAENGLRATISVDLVVHAAHVLSVPVVSLLTDQPWCERCNNNPPPGFTCNECGAGA